MEFKLVYGNHGKDPFHIMDTLLLVKYSLESLGHKADLEEYLTPGKTNILLECFTYDFIEAYKEVKKTPGTEYLIIGTEYITGETFNDFCEPADELRRHSHYEAPNYWKKRFKTFLLAQEHARAVWHLSESQIEAFRRATGNDRVYYLPHGYAEGFARIRQKPEAHKDIDAIFTGTLTKHRLDVIEALEARGIKAIARKPLNTVQREDLIARAKIGINLKQTVDWKYASNSRYHYHLSNNSLLVSEHCEVPCDLSRYVVEASPDGLAETCLEWLANPRRQQEADERLARFAAEMPMTRLLGGLLDQTYSAA